MTENGTMLEGGAGEHLHHLTELGLSWQNVRRARAAVAFVFFLNGFTFATWAARVPAIQEKLQLSPGELGAALMGLNGGAVFAPTVAGKLVAHYGTRRILVAGMIIYLSGLPAVGLAPSLPWLAAALLLFAVGNTCMDVAMNVQGICVERLYRRSLLGGLHAMFSLGGLAGAAVGSAAAFVRLGALTHFTGVAIALAALGAAAVALLIPEPVLRRVLPSTSPGGTGKRRLAGLLSRESRRVWIAGAICFGAMMSEGVMNDWSAVYMRDVAGATSGMAAAGFAVFSFGMVAGRFGGDRIRDRIGTVRFIRACSVMAAAGGVLSVASPLAGLSCAGYLLLGLGLAAIIPVIFSDAAHGQPGNTTSAIAAVSAIGYSGFLAGPPLIGALAAMTGMRAAFVVLPLLMIMVYMLARRLGATR